MNALDRAYERIRRYRGDKPGFSSEFLGLDPHPGQRRWLENATAAEDALVTGNRWGKSHIAAAQAIYACLYRPTWTPKIRAQAKRSSQVFYALNASITADQSKIVWYKAHAMLQGPKISWVVRDVKMTPFPTIIFANGSVFEARSTTRDGHHLLGHDYDFVNWDEAAYEKRFEVILDNVLRMRLVDRGGMLHFTSTGNGRNAFGRYFLTGLPGAKKDPELYSQTGATWENPHVDQERLAKNAARMSERMRQQNIEGAIVDSGGDFFSIEDLDGCHDETLDEQLRVLAYDDEDVEAWAQLWPDPEVPWRLRYGSHRYVHGWDLADKRDWTVGITLDVSTTPQTVVEFERFHRLGWEHVYARIRDRHHRYGGVTAIDNTGLGDVVESDLADVRPVGVNFAGGRKDALLTNLQTALALRAIRWPLIKPMVDELGFYQRDDEGLVKDCVMSLAVAAWAARRAVGNVPASTIR
ncbi:hypothetical protein EPN42_05625 [bacterium]|nr:MAG: hypothetical protein EPN42_05625 [bacterium]